MKNNPSIAFDAINALRPASILDVVPRGIFHEIDDPNYRHIGNGDCFEWKYAIAKWLQPRSILEIGVRYGYSMASFIMGSDAIEYVEGWDSELYVIGSNDIAAAAVKSLPKKFELCLRTLDSQTIENLSRPFDLVHIDASHLYASCLHDLKLCFGKTKAILIDDTTTCPDDMRAVLTFAAENDKRIKELIHIYSHVGETLILLH